MKCGGTAISCWPFHSIYPPRPPPAPPPPTQCRRVTSSTAGPSAGTPLGTPSLPRLLRLGRHPSTSPRLWVCKRRISASPQLWVHTEKFYVSFFFICTVGTWKILAQTWMNRFVNEQTQNYVAYGLQNVAASTTVTKYEEILRVSFVLALSFILKFKLQNKPVFFNMATRPYQK